MYFYFLTYKFNVLLKNNLFVDFIIKKLIEICVKNYLILTPMFFGEKYMIEFFTKKTTNFLLSRGSFYWLFRDVNFYVFFINLIITLFYLLSFFFFLIFIL